MRNSEFGIRNYRASLGENGLVLRWAKVSPYPPKYESGHLGDAADRAGTGSTSPRNSEFRIPNSELRKEIPLWI